jgi:hypothetical protein
MPARGVDLGLLEPAASMEVRPQAPDDGAGAGTD